MKQLTDPLSNVLTLLVVAACLIASEACIADEAAVEKAAVGEARFYIRAYEVHDNALLSATEIETALYDYMGPDRVASDVELARAALQSVYEKHGYPTVIVSIPEQSVVSGIIRLDVTEQKVATLEVTGVSPKNRAAILLQAPSLQVGSTPNFTQLQQDMVELNSKRDRRITPEINPGEAPNTLDAKLIVEQSLPLHGSVEFNNRGSAATSKQRVSAQLHYDDLWGRGDTISFSYQTAPQRKEDGLVYSASYLGRWRDSRTQLLGYAVKSDADITTVAGMRIIGRGNIVGARMIKPLHLAGQGSGDKHHSITLGLDYKKFSDNLSGEGVDDPNTPEVETDHPTIRYLPLMAGWRVDVLKPEVDADLTASVVFGVRGLGDDVRMFDAKRYRARPNFFAIQLQGSRTDTFAHDIQTYIGLDSQWTAHPLISNQQFSIGGMQSVRGYNEGEVLGDYGMSLQFELRSPSATWLGSWADEVRLHLFADAGSVQSYDTLPTQDNHKSLASAGLGLRCRAFHGINFDAEAGLPFTDGQLQRAGKIHAQFRVWGEF